MARSRRAVTVARTPASAKATAGKPAAAAPAAGTRIPAVRAFLLNACFVAGLLVLSQLSLLQQRPTVRASVVAAALFLLAPALLSRAKGVFVRAHGHRSVAAKGYYTLPAAVVTIPVAGNSHPGHSRAPTAGHAA